MLILLIIGLWSSLSINVSQGREIRHNKNGLPALLNRNSMLTPKGISSANVEKYFSFLTTNDSFTKDTEDKQPVNKLVEGTNLNYPLTGALILAGLFTCKYVKEYNRRQLISTDAPRISDIIGHALLEKSKTPSFFQKLLCILYPLRGYLFPLANYISTQNAIPKDSLVALYFHSGNVEQILKTHGYPLVNPKLKALQEVANMAGKPLKIIYASLDRWYSVAYDHFMQMDWYAIPFDERNKLENLCHRFEIDSLPSIVLLDSNGNVVNDRALYVMLSNPNGYPWKVDSIIDLLGEKLVDQHQNSVDVSSIKGSTVGLYFGTQGKTPQGFSEKLATFYKSMKKKTGGKFELVYLSNDKNIEQFQSQIKSLGIPILAVPFEHLQTRILLQNYVKIYTTPSLVLVGKNGKIITRDGRFYVETDPMAENISLDTNTGVNDISSNIDGFAQFPAVIAFAEHSSSREKKEILRQMNSLSEEHSSNRRGKELKFFICFQSHPRSDAIRRLCGLPKATLENSKHVKMVILDLLHQKVYIEPDINSLKKLGNKVSFEGNISNLSDRTRLMLELFYGLALPSKDIRLANS